MQAQEPFLAHAALSSLNSSTFLGWLTKWKLQKIKNTTFSQLISKKQKQKDSNFYSTTYFYNHQIPATTPLKQSILANYVVISWRMKRWVVPMYFGIKLTNWTKPSHIWHQLTNCTCPILHKYWIKTEIKFYQLDHLDTLFCYQNYQLHLTKHILMPADLSKFNIGQILDKW